MTTITALRVEDIRFPTSLGLDGSDAMNPDPDYSAAYVIHGDRSRGSQRPRADVHHRPRQRICCAAIRALEHQIVGERLEDIAADMGAFWRRFTSDSQLRWIGPDKGPFTATGAVVNAVWDLWAKSVGKPVWRLVAEMTPEELVRCIDFRYITDCITPQEALALLKQRAEGKERRPSDCCRKGTPVTPLPPAGWVTRMTSCAACAGKRSTPVSPT